MRRGSSGEHFLRLLEKIRAALPDVTLRTSFIVGFPGETEEDFELLLDFVEAAQFDHLGVFLYSERRDKLRAMRCRARFPRRWRAVAGKS